MKIEAYLENFPPHPLISRDCFTGAGHIRQCLLAFNEETACCWGGPFPGNYALAILRDATLSKYYANRLGPVSAFDQERQDTFRRSDTKTRNALKWETWQNVPLEYPSIEYPISVYVCGNDDTSFTKYFATIQEGEEFLNLLESIADDKPLDMFEDFHCFGFAFTN